MASNIIQIQLLDSTTGEVISDVFPLTQAEAVKLEDGTDLKTYLSNLVLQKGDTGPAGKDGNSVLNGTSDPTSSTGKDGDFYINTASNMIFGPKASGAWSAGKSIVGPTGPKGSTGATGTQGPKGDTGATGAQGPKGDKGDKGDPGDNVKYGTSLASASEIKLFFKQV